jgi:acetoin utilization protein AcuC
MDAFWKHACSCGLDMKVTVRSPVMAGRDTLVRFHTPEYVDLVIARSAAGAGFLDRGDTPAVAGIYEAACHVAGSTLDAVDRLMNGECRHALVPIAGLHHARRDTAAGFCVFNDCGIAIETLFSVYALQRVAYVDIDAHHGDGVYYSFEDDPRLGFADIHEDGRYLYPGTGSADERGTGTATGAKLNLPVLPDSGDDVFFPAWEQIEEFLDDFRPEFILFQCGADGIDGDPITHLRFTPAAHAHAARRLCRIADRHCGGRLLAMGGGGYNRGNLAVAWTAVLEALQQY